nr:BlaI/MecI/CopY family transcriptional regulator [Lachnospiraceae bacterium]
MKSLQLGEMETKFAEIIWENEPIPSGELARICSEKLHWSRTTMYTVLRRLCAKGIFINERGIVTSLQSKENVTALRSEQFIIDNFNGSLPSFFAAFTQQRKLTEEEYWEISRMIDEAVQARKEKDE